MRRLSFLLLCVISICNFANAALLKSYDFDGGYSDTLGNGVDLIDGGGALVNGFYNFSDNQGLKLTSALTNTSDYAIEMRLSINDSVSSWNKLIDFQELASDNGLYVLNGNFDFYVSGVNILGGPVTVGEFFTISFVRNAGIITTFFNGVALTSFTDSSNQAVSAANVLNFFEDDVATNKTESFIGAVDYIRIHDDESTFGSAPIISVPAPHFIWLFAMLLISMVSLRHKR